MFAFYIYNIIYIQYGFVRNLNGKKLASIFELVDFLVVAIDSFYDVMMSQSQL